jgi:hypothetical protein
MRVSHALRFGAFVLCGLVAACDPATMSLSGASGAGAPSRAKVTVAGRPVVIAAPAGFCIDAPSTAVTADGAFVLMSDCALLGRSRGGRPPVGAALTASVSAGGLGGEGDDEAATLADLQHFLDTADGRALVSRSGRGDRVRIISRQLKGDVLYVLVDDRGQQPIAGIDPRFWRAFLEVNGRMTVLSVIGFAGTGPGLQDSLNQLAATAASIRAANPGA